MASWPGRSPVTEPARTIPAWLLGQGDRPYTDTGPGADTDTQADTGTGPHADTDTQADTRPGAQADTGETVSPAQAGIATLAIPAADGAPLPLGERLAARYNDLPEWARDLLWPFIRLAHGSYTGHPGSMADYHRYIAGREWVHPMLDGWGRRISAGAGVTYHVLIGQWVTALGSLLAYCGPRPLRLLGLVISIIGFAVFVRLI